MRSIRRLLQGAVIVTVALGAGRASGADPSVPVRVINTPLPVTVTNPTLTIQIKPFQRQFTLDWVDGEDLVTGSYQVPAGFRLVIEYASLSAYLQPEGQSMFVRILTTAGGTTAFHALAVQKQEDFGVLKQFGAAHPVRIYADPGSTVQVSAGRVPLAGTANCTLTLSGHLENVL
jgi:hypothetical protein